MEPYAKNRVLRSFNYNIKETRSHKKGESQKRTQYCEDIFTFDIETTSFFYADNLRPFLYRPGKDPEYWKDQKAGALPYLWQLGINDHYYYGRDISEFYEALSDIPNHIKIRIAVHNLSFEWHFLDTLHWDFVFAKSRHKPIKAICIEFPNIEFYCTYALIDKSLEEWGEALGIPKLVGNLEYNKLRTPLTRLTKKELKYAERDLEIMYKGISEELEIYGSVWNLPMTATGAVRRIAKEVLMSNDDYKRYIKKLVPSNWYQYATSRKVFWGGYAHANRCYSGITWINKNGNLGDHLDYISAYIAQMVRRKGFPASDWAYAPKVLPDPEKDLEVKAYKLHLRFYNIRCEKQNTYIPFNKIKSENAVVDNGKLVSADMIDIWCTDLDYYVIRKMYTWGKERKNEHEGVEVLESWYAYTDYLPKALVSILLDLFNKKTALKHVDDKEYRRAKKKLDSIYGMCATSMIQANINWDINGETWGLERVTARDVEERIHKLKYWRDTRYFVSYDWGLFISAWSRYTLMMDLIIPNDRICMYSDTDSGFLSKKIDILKYNKNIENIMMEVCNKRGIDPELIRPKNCYGEKQVLGALAREPEFIEFRTLGSKRYAERSKETGDLSITVSGINKEAVECLNNNINNFCDGTIFDKDSKEVSKLLHTYFDRMPDITFPDGYISHQRRGVNLRPNGYRLRAEREPEEIIEDIAKGAKVSEYEKHLRGVVHDGGTD